ncbi:hypothetical protein PoB_002366900 [Plakobranchus ocellatus]|uniref:Uncharacterized protein n=1 Tax=Plakobranchus ocellatus TaxID=259542 RepID=A0AAV3ZTF8_9GAST|nr:hypothetical protein PoB_002366900 [Plakobranchus ocellatus]
MKINNDNYYGDRDDEDDDADKLQILIMMMLRKRRRKRRGFRRRRRWQRKRIRPRRSKKKGRRRLRVRRGLRWGQGAGGAGRTRDRNIPADLRADSLSTVPLTKEVKKEKIVGKRRRMSMMMMMMMINNDISLLIVKAKAKQSFKLSVQNQTFSQRNEEEGGGRSSKPVSIFLDIFTHVGGSSLICRHHVCCRRNAPLSLSNGLRQGLNKPRVEGRRPRSNRDRESNGSRTCGSNFPPRDLNPAAKVGVPISRRSARGERAKS